MGELETKFKVFEPKESPYIARIIHKQVQEYFHNGILDDIVKRHGNRNITVFDVGSNIGMFALEVMRRTEGEANVYCFEPVPATYSVLDLNIKESIDPPNAFRKAGQKVKALPFGLSDSARTVTFSYRPHAPECSSMYDAQLLKGDRTTMSREDEIEHFTEKAYDPDFPLWKDHPLMYCFVKSVYPRFMLRAGVAKWLDDYNKTEEVTANLRRLSSVIEQEKVKKIDLLKIDVELAELDVLKGIDDQDWPKIEAVVIEVHDVDGRLDEIKSLLTMHHISDFTIFQEDGMKGGNIFHVCARRPRSSMTSIDLYV